MSAELVVAPDAETGSVDEELAEEWARFRDVLWYGSIKDARALIAEMAQRWPDSERVQHYARVLHPPVARRIPEPTRSVEKETTWLKEHAREYPGCWIAVKGDQFVAADPDLKVVIGRVESNPEWEGAVLYYKTPPETGDGARNGEHD